MELNRVVDHIMILDLVMVARKSAIDRMGVYTEVPTDPVDVSLWMSTIIRKYVKQLLPNCYTRKNRYTFSVRLDLPEFDEMYAIIANGHRINSRYYANADEKNRVSRMLMNLQNSMRTNSDTYIQIKPDGKLFLYIPHTVRVYDRSGHGFMESLERIQIILNQWRGWYEGEFQQLKDIIAAAETCKNNGGRPVVRQVAPQPAPAPAPVPTPVVRPVERPQTDDLADFFDTNPVRQERVLNDTPAPSVVLTPLGRTVNDTEQNRFNDILRRVTAHRTADNGETAVVRDEEPVLMEVEADRTIYELRMLPSDYDPDMDNDIVIDRVGGERVYIGNADQITRMLAETELPQGIPSVDMPFSEDLMYELGNDLESSIVEGTNGIYYVPEPLYYVVVNGSIIGRFTDLEEATTNYRTATGTNDSITILYPVTEMFDRDRSALAPEDNVPRDVNDTYYQTIQQEQDRMEDRVDRHRLVF
jgi:hypothetical protein